VKKVSLWKLLVFMTSCILVISCLVFIICKAFIKKKKDQSEIVIYAPMSSSHSNQSQGLKSETFSINNHGLSSDDSIINGLGSYTTY
jgi:hypothetical protein